MRIKTLHDNYNDVKEINISIDGLEIELKFYNGEKKTILWKDVEFISDKNYEKK